MDKNRYDDGDLGFKKFGCQDIEIARYVYGLLDPEDRILSCARKAAEAGGLPDIQLGKFDVRHLEVLVRMTGAKRAVEFGTLGGYSGLAISRAMGADSLLYTLEISGKHAAIAEKVWSEARADGAVFGQIQCHVGPAVDSMKSLKGPFDLVFIDADKANYVEYFKWSADQLRLGGVIFADNTFAFGHIFKNDMSGPDGKTVNALRAYNLAAAKDPRFLTTLLPTGEGLTVSVKVRD